MRMLWLVVLLGFEVEGAQDAQSVGCVMDNAITLDCDDLGLTSIPTGILESVVTVKLKANMIHNGGGRLTAASILAGRMHGGLEELQLNTNGIYEIDTNTFDGFGTLLVLKLAGNKLTEAKPGMFSGLSGLGELWLNNMNELTKLNAGAFADFADTLYLLNLKTTGLRILEDGSLNAIVIPEKSDAGGPFVVDTRDAVSLCATSPMNEIKCICDVGLVGEDEGFCEVPTTSTVVTEVSTTSSSISTSVAETTTGNDETTGSTGTTAPDVPATTTRAYKVTVPTGDPNADVNRETLVNPSPIIPGNVQEKLNNVNGDAGGKAGKGKKGKGKGKSKKGKKGKKGKGEASQSGLTISVNRETGGKVDKKGKKKHAKSVLQKIGVSKLKGDVDVTGRIPVLGGVALLAMCGTVLIGAAYSRQLQEQHTGRGSGRYTRVGSGSEPLEKEPNDRRPLKSVDTIKSVAAIGAAKNNEIGGIGKVVHF